LDARERPFLLMATGRSRGLSCHELNRDSRLRVASDKLYPLITFPFSGRTLRRGCAIFLRVSMLLLLYTVFFSVAWAWTFLNSQTLFSALALRKCCSMRRLHMGALGLARYLYTHLQSSPNFMIIIILMCVLRWRLLIILIF